MNAHAAVRRNHSHGKRELGARTSSIRLAAPEDGVLDEMLGRAGDAIPTRIATEILRRLVAHAKERGCQWALLHSMTKAEPLYERAGFIEAHGGMRLDLR